MLQAAHIRWGKSASSRLPELRLLADSQAQRRRERYLADKDVFVMGDLNIPSRESPLFQAVTKRGLRVPDGLLGSPGSDLARGKRYDQILHDPVCAGSFSKVGGVLDFYCMDHQALFPGTPMSLQEFTFQLSDHLPLWLQVVTNAADVAQGVAGPA